MRIFASRQCADYARARYMQVQVRRVWHMLRFAVGEASYLVFVVSKPRWPRAVVPDLHLYLNVSDCVTHTWPIPVPRPRLWYVTTFHVTFLSVTHHHTYFVRIDPQFRASR